MNDDHMLTPEDVKRLRSTIQTVEFTGNQMAVLANALAFNLVHNDCLMQHNQYSEIYYAEVKKLHEYIGSYVTAIIGDKDNGKKDFPPTKK